MKVNIIGLGEIGYNTLKEMTRINKEKKLNIKLYGTDINKEIIENLKKEKYKVSNKIIKADIYIISVYTTKQVFDVIKKIDYSKNPLVIVESTIEPGSYKKIMQWNKHINLVLFPHRYNPNDRKHYIFNLNRVMGYINNGNESDIIVRAVDFYKNFMDINLIHHTDIDIAEIVKPLENAYRFIEIAIAENIKIVCENNNIDFDKLRKAMNTKWNIDLKEARNGIGGKCLPKDVDLVIKSFNLNRDSIFNMAKFIDDIYKISYVK